MNINIRLEGGMLPQKAHPGDAAFDLYVPEDIELRYGRQVVDLMFSIEIPKGYAATIQPRSGCSVNGIEVVWTYREGGKTVTVEKHKLDADVIRGLIDSNYRGHVGVILKVDELPFMEDTVWILKKGSRIAQMQIVPVPEVELVRAERLTPSERDVRGFGSTGQS